MDFSSSNKLSGPSSAGYGTNSSRAKRREEGGGGEEEGGGGRRRREEEGGGGEEEGGGGRRRRRDGAKAMQQQEERVACPSYFSPPNETSTRCRPQYEAIKPEFRCNFPLSIIVATSFPWSLLVALSHSITPSPFAHCVALAPLLSQQQRTAIVLHRCTRNPHPPRPLRGVHCYNTAP